MKKVIAASLALSLCIALAGCVSEGGTSSSGGSSSSSVPSQEKPGGSSSSGSSSGNITPEQAEENIRNAIQAAFQKYGMHPRNESASWVTYPGQYYVAKLSTSGRLYDGQWIEARRATNYMGDYALLLGWRVFRSVPSDDREGTDCVWDGNELKYIQSNVNDPSTYLSKPGMKYECYVAENGALHGGWWVSESYPEKSEKAIYFRSFPYNTTGASGYKWDGVRLSLNPPHQLEPCEWADIGDDYRYVFEIGRDGNPVPQSGVIHRISGMPDSFPTEVMILEKRPIYPLEDLRIENGEFYFRPRTTR